MFSTSLLCMLYFIPPVVVQSDLLSLCCSWKWVYDVLEVDPDDNGDVEAAPLPTVESAEVEQSEDSEIEEKDKDEASAKDKKKRVGFRDRKVSADFSAVVPPLFLFAPCTVIFIDLMSFPRYY